MVTRLPSLLVLAVACACDPDAGALSVDLCAPPEASLADLATLDRATAWQLVVFGLRREDLAFRRSVGGGSLGTATLLRADSILPAETAVRLLVQGYGYDADGGVELLALGASEALEPEAGDRLCLCVMPPERYGALCLDRRCAYSPSAGCRMIDAAPY